MTYQHFKLVESMTAMKNILLGQEHKLITNTKKVEERVKNTCDTFSLYIDINKYIYDMSVGEKQNI